MTSRVEDRLAALELVADRSAVIYYATSAAGDTTFAAGYAAGSYTAQLRGKSTGGAAVFRLTAGDDFINLAMWEVGA
jgi:hypothetical protein